MAATDQGRQPPRRRAAEPADELHRPGRDRGLRGGAHDAAGRAARRAGGGDAAPRCARRRCSPGRSRAASSSCSSTASRRERVLELGTYSGYSSLSMAAGLAGGRPHRHLRGRRDARRGRAPLHRAASPYADRITVHVGPALDTIEQLDGRVRLRLHRRGQGELPQLLRGGGAAARRERADRRRQHALERPRARRERRLGRHGRSAS